MVLEGNGCLSVTPGFHHGSQLAIRQWKEVLFTRGRPGLWLHSSWWQRREENALPGKCRPSTCVDGLGLSPVRRKAQDLVYFDLVFEPHGPGIFEQEMNNLIWSGLIDGPTDEGHCQEVAAH